MIYTTFACIEDAEKFSARLLDEKLAACVNIFPNMISCYEWRGKRMRDCETAMFIKSRQSLKKRLLERARRLHPYDVPVLMVLEVGDIDGDYMSWLRTQTFSLSQGDS